MAEPLKDMPVLIRKTLNRMFLYHLIDLKEPVNVKVIANQQKSFKKIIMGGPSKILLAARRCSRRLVFTSTVINLQR